MAAVVEVMIRIEMNLPMYSRDRGLKIPGGIGKMQGCQTGWTWDVIDILIEIPANRGTSTSAAVISPAMPDIEIFESCQDLRQR